MSSDLEKAMLTIVQIFHKYSGHKCKLKKADLKHLINNEMSQFIKVSVWDQSYGLGLGLVKLTVKGLSHPSFKSVRFSSCGLWKMIFYYQIMQAKYEVVSVSEAGLSRVKCYALNMKYEEKNPQKTVSIFCRTK